MDDPKEEREARRELRHFRRIPDNEVEQEVEDTAEAAALDEADVEKLREQQYDKWIEKQVGEEREAEAVALRREINGMPLSPQQAAVVDWIENDEGSANVIARAGSGKTYLLRAALGVMEGNVFVGAFNRAIREEFDEKFKHTRTRADVTIQTFHQAGLRAWGRHTRSKSNLFTGKIPTIVKQMSLERDEQRCECSHGRDDHADGVGACTSPSVAGNDGCTSFRGAERRWIRTNYGSFLKKLVDLIRDEAFGCPGGPNLDDHEAWVKLIDHHNLGETLRGSAAGNRKSYDTGIELAKVVLQRSIDRTLDDNTIDFRDMIYMPLWADATLPRYDFVLIDEAQDVNVARRLMALKMMRPRDGRLLAVGDDKQAVYGFTGADADSMENIRREVEGRVFPLTMTYRCGKAIVKEAQKWVPDVEALPDAHEGTVGFSTFEWLIECLGDNEGRQRNLDLAVICRNNWPLVKLCFQLIKLGVPCRIEGSDVAAGLKRLIEDLNTRQIGTLLAALADLRETRVKQLEADEKWAQAHQLADQIDTLSTLAELLSQSGARATSEVSDYIDRMFCPEEPGQVLMATIHKSKGREWSTVYFLGPELIPSKWARQQWQKDQESNLAYVAITRAKSELVYVELPVEKKRADEDEERGV